MVLELSKGRVRDDFREVRESGLAGPCLLIAPGGPRKILTC